MKQKEKGKVIFAGAGCGDPELLTLKAFNYLQKADVVLCDRLVSNVITESYVNSNAEIIFVGKQCDNNNSTSQTVINELMVSYARQGKLVIRLKGGDVSIYSNILDELEALVASGLPYEIIPGITAALGAAAYTGIPLTARGYSRAVRFLTSFDTEVIHDQYWKELAQTDDTLVFYMSTRTAAFIAEKLVAHNINHERLMAVVEQATSPNQTVRIYDLYDFSAEIGKRHIKLPGLLIVGKVVQLYDQFKWFGTNNVSTNYFEFIKAAKPQHEIQAA